MKDGPTTKVVCGYCDAVFEIRSKVYRNRLRRNQKAFYCPKCVSGENAAARFWKKVDRSGGDESCWIWLGGLDSGGYGLFRYKGKNTKAHRFAYELFFSALVEIDACHSCDNPRCVNPKHIWPGSAFDNMRDMVLKKRHNPMIGEANTNAKLTPLDVLEIYDRANRGDGLREISDAFGVSMSTVSDIKHKKTWRHIFDG